MNRGFFIFVFSVLVISMFGNAYAIGRGGGGESDATNEGQRVAAVGASAIDCEDSATLPTMRDRIKCRIQNREIYIAPTNSVPEACRDLRTPGLSAETSQGRCVAYYRVISSCYNEDSPQSKRGCLMRAAGIANSRLADETENRRQKARDYTIALLYNLEERIENKNKEGLISDETAAEGINKIVEIKRMLLQGESGATIRQKIIELKVWWSTNISPLRFTNEREEETVQ